jgi:hypothetical protein
MSNFLSFSTSTEGTIYLNKAKLEAGVFPPVDLLPSLSQLAKYDGEREEKEERGRREKGEGRSEKGEGRREKEEGGTREERGGIYLNKAKLEAGVYPPVDLLPSLSQLAKYDGERKGRGRRRRREKGAGTREERGITSTRQSWRPEFILRWISFLLCRSWLSMTGDGEERQEGRRRGRREKRGMTPIGVLKQTCCPTTCLLRSTPVMLLDKTLRITVCEEVGDKKVEGTNRKLEGWWRLEGGRLEGWEGGRVEGWKGGRLEGWKGGRVEGWKGGRVEGWKGGRVEGWKGGRVEFPKFRTLSVEAHPELVKSPEELKYLDFLKSTDEFFNQNSARRWEVTFHGLCALLAKIGRGACTRIPNDKFNQILEIGNKEAPNEAEGV